MIFHKQLGDDIVRVNMLFNRSQEAGINIEVCLSTFTHKDKMVIYSRSYNLFTAQVNQGY